MTEYKENLMYRIEQLEESQKEMIILNLLFNASREQLESIESEVKSYEEINKEKPTLADVSLLD